LAKLPRFALLLMAGLAIVDAALRLSSDQCRMVALSLTVGLVVGIGWMLLDRLTDGYVRQIVTGQVLDNVAFLNAYSAAATLTALFVWPLTAAAARIHVLALVALWLLVLGAVMSLISSAAVLAIFIGGAGFALVALAPRIGGAVIAAVIVLSILVAPALPPTQKQSARLLETYDELPRSGYHRLLIWRFVADRIIERPVLGWGFNSSRDIPGRERQLDLHEKALPLHPHNAALQWWLELGAPGAILGAALIIWLMRAIGRARASNIGKASAVSLVLSTVTVSFLSYGIWQSWWIATMWLAGVFMVVLIRAAPAETVPGST
jgi:O-antigen ligase